MEGSGFEAWYRREHPRVLGVLCAVSGDVDAAAEATDEAFARALADWSRVEAMDSPGGWTHRVALNVLRRTLRRRAIEARLLPRGATAASPDVLPDTEIWTAVRSLPPRQRTACALRYLTDLPEAEIARVMRVSRGTVASTLSDARRTLARLLADEPVPAEVPHA